MTTYGTAGYGKSEGQLLVGTTYAQKQEMHGLNDRLAEFIKQIKHLREGHLDPDKYHAMLKQLEDELKKLQDMYEDELDKTRQKLKDANKEKNTFSNQADNNQQAINQLQNQLQLANDNNRALQNELGNLQRALAAKDQENADCKRIIDELQREINELKPAYGNAMRENEALRQKYDQERREKQEAQERAKQLQDKLDFDNKAKDNEIRDLKDRLRNNDAIIRGLEDKLQKASARNTEEMKRMIDKMRKENEANLNKYRQETENELNANLNHLRQQLNEAERENAELKKERKELEDLAKDVIGKKNLLEGEVQGLKEQCRALEDALNNERAKSDREIADLRRKLQDLQDQVMARLKEFKDTRDQQTGLQSEIDTYRHLLDASQERVGYGNSISARAGYMDSNLQKTGGRPLSNTGMKDSGYRGTGSPMNTGTMGAGGQGTGTSVAPGAPGWPQGSVTHRDYCQGGCKHNPPCNGTRVSPTGSMTKLPQIPTGMGTSGYTRPMQYGPRQPTYADTAKANYGRSQMYT